MNVKMQPKEPDWYLLGHKPITKLINRFSELTYVSKVLKFILTPIYIACKKIQDFI